ncbi:MAG: GntR family transcriptional regulator [Solirubrobacterales bacterium]|jgi:DNA-binding GntR family transcriptional regulator|nr:GntR family transcriptional regulator [Solirubrobacterales bacterium]
MQSPGNTSDRPIAYRALASDLREAIVRDELGPDRRVPTEAELSASYGVSRQTVRRALQDLVAEGLVYRVRGRGTFALRSGGGGQYLRSFGTIDDLLAMSQDTVLEVLAPLRSRVNVDAAGRLDLPNDVVMEGLFRRLHAEDPFCVTQIYLPPDVGELIAANRDLGAAGDHTSETLISVIETVRSKPISRAQQSITAVALPDDLGDALDVPAGTPVLRVDRAYFDTEDRAVELAISHFDPDRYSYRLEMVRVLGSSTADGEPAAAPGA